jgi:two-component system sensor histidine kinase DegS
MGDENGSEAKKPVDEFLETTRSELDQVRTELTEISLLVEQSQGEVDKLAQRNASVTAHLHQMQAHFDTVPREDIRDTYEVFHDAQQRLFTMRGQLEKLQSDETHLKRFEAFLVRTLEIIEGRPSLAVSQISPDEGSVIQQIIEAQEEEKRKISRQIHDGPAQALSNFILQTEIVMRLFNTDQDKARDELENLKATAGSTFGQVRDFIFDLRPMMLDDLGLVPTARRYTEAYKNKSGLDINFVVTGTERRLAAHLEVLAFRAIQTLLRNVREHAQATQVKVLLDMGDQKLRATVDDNGKGFDPEALKEEDLEKYGYTTLQDRIGKVGGTFEIDSSAGEGTRITFTVPIGE